MTTELGTEASEAKTWTNTNAAGMFITSASDDSACDDWSKGSGPGGSDRKGTFGLNDKTNFGWSVDGVDVCSNKYHVYCIG